MPDEQPAAAAAQPATPENENCYDEFPYDSHPFVQSHPSRLFAIGTLFNLHPAPVQRCRVLEIGCAAGGNLIPMAEFLPDSTFVGIDLSGRQINDALQIAKDLALKNLTLKKANILDVDASYGTFDYIIAHGIFSWVPPPVRQKLLEICAKHLAPDGIAYVSYNTYPGWHMRGMIRDMMRFHTQRFHEPRVRVQQARALLDFLAQSVKQEGAYSHLLKDELEYLRTKGDYYLLHDHLEEMNEPVYFHQFAEMALQKGLKYLSDARAGTMFVDNFGPDVAKTLRTLAPDQIQAEQYMDFLRNRMFRESLLCRADGNPNWSVNPALLRGLHVACNAKPIAPDGQNQINLDDRSPVTYRGLSGMTITTNLPLLKYALRVLQDIFPATLPFAELHRLAFDRMGGANAHARAPITPDESQLDVALLNCYFISDLVELHGVPITISPTVPERPTASLMARLLAVRFGATTNRRHEFLRLNQLDRALIPLLDGTRDRAALVEQLTDFVLQGRLTVKLRENVLTDRTEVKNVMASIIDQALINISRMAILTA